MRILSRRSETFTTGAMLAPVLLLFFVIYIGPLASLLADSIRNAEGLTLSHYVEALTSPTFGKIMLRTIQLSVVVTGLCVLAGYPLAYALSRMRGQLAAALLLVVCIPYLTSSLIRTYAWIVVLGPYGPVNQTLHWLGIISSPLTLVFNSFGVYVGMVHIQLPLMIFPLYAAMVRIDRAHIDAARSLGSSPASAFWRVFAPLSLPGIVAGSTLVFLSSLGFYITPALLGGPGEYMLSQGISLRVLRFADFVGAATQSAILLLVVVGVVFMVRKRLGAELLDEQATHLNHHDGDGLSRLPGWIVWMSNSLTPALKVIGELISAIRRPVLCFVGASVIAFLVLPILTVIPLAFSSADYLTFPPPGYSLRWFKQLFNNSQWIGSALFSLKMAGISAVLSLAFGVPAAFALVRRRISLRLPTYLLLISPLVVPQVVFAVALYFPFSQWGLIGTSTGFVLAYSLIGIPSVIVIFTAGLKHFDRSLERAAASLGAAPLSVLATVTLPLLVPTLSGALIFAFIAAFDDVIFGLFMAGSGATPLPMRMLEDIKFEVSPQIAVVAVLLFGALIIGYAIQLLVTLHFRPTGGLSPNAATQHDG